MTIARPAQYVINDVTQEVRVIRHPTGMLITGVPKANHPVTTEKIQQELESEIQNDKTKMTFRISLNRDTFSNRGAAICWLRSGYLAAFAAFGYRYIFGKAFENVRNQIAEPKANLISGFSITVPRIDPKERNIILTSDPSWLCAVGMQMGEYIVLLPVDSGDETFYLRLQSESEKAKRLALQGERVASWPESPKLACDFI